MSGARAGEVRLEAGGALSPPLPADRGVERKEVDQLLSEGELGEVLPALLGPHAPSGFLAAARRPSLLHAVQQSARSWRRRRLEDLVHIGIGGSSLGAETLLRALAHPLHDLLDRRRRGGPRVHFLDNVDPETLGGLLEVLDPGRTLLHVVSKSGTTVETAAGFQVLRAAVGERTWRRRCVVTCGPGILRQLARREGIPVLDFPADVGGRFSVLTPSGLLTPALAGVDVASVVRGARRLLRWLQRTPLAANPAAVAGAIAWLLAERRGMPIQVLMPYADALEPLARWNQQLVAESLGKIVRRGEARQGVGPTPLAARGSTDQHSQVQLFVEGPADKLVTFIRVEQPRRELRIPGGEPAPYLADIELGALLRAEQRGTAVALARAGRPWLCWEMPAISPGTMGELFLLLELQTVYQARLYGVDAYDQPGVEAGKRAAFALLGRSGYEDEREDIEAHGPPSWKL